MNKKQEDDGVDYLKEVLRDAATSNMPREIQIALGEMILHAYLRGREDEARLHVSTN